MCVCLRRVVAAGLVLLLLTLASDRPLAAEKPARPGLTPAPLDAGSWPNFRNGLQMQGLAAAPLPDKLHLRWSRPIADGMVFTSSPAVFDGRVYVPTLGGELLCLDLKSGKLRWRYLSGPKPDENTFIPGFPTAPAITKTTVFLGDEDGVFHAVNRKTGKPRWKFQTQGTIYSSAVVLGDRVLFGSNDSNLYCLAVADGKKHWQFTTSERINGSPAIAGKYTFVTGCDSHLRMINVETGKQEHDMMLGSFVIASPAIYGDMLYVGTYEGQFLAVDWKKQKIVWQYGDGERRQPYHASAAIKGNRVVIAGQDKRLQCLDRKTGKRLWSFSTRAQINSSPVIAGKTVYFGSADKWVYAVDLLTGKSTWKFQGKTDFNAAPAVAGGCLLIGSEGSRARLYCFGAK